LCKGQCYKKFIRLKNKIFTIITIRILIKYTFHLKMSDLYFTIIPVFKLKNEDRKQSKKK